MNKKKSVILLVIVLTILGSWSAVLDQFSEDYVKDSLIEAGIAYGTARGINAAVSILQSTEIGVGVGVNTSLNIGEVLDPLNDLIERFSDVMAVVIGSLMLQKILIVIVTNKIFSIALTCLGILSGFIIVFKPKPYAKPALRLFFVFMVIRFSIILVLILNSIVGDLFISDQIQHGNEALQNDEAKFKSMSGNETTDVRYLEISQDIAKKTQEKVRLEKDLMSINKVIKDKEAEENLAWYSMGDNEYKALKKKQDINESKIEDLEDEIEDAREALNGDVSMLTRFNKIKESLTPSVVADKVSDMIDNIFELLMLFILQTVLLPLLFLYSFKYLVKSAWNMDVDFE